MRNARVKIQGLDTATVSENGGFYRLGEVAPGPVTLIVSCTGYTPTATDLRPVVLTTINPLCGLRTVNQYTAEEFGYGNDPDFSNYTFISGVSSDGIRLVKDFEVEHSQSLSFLPAPFKGLNVRAATRATMPTAGASTSCPTPCPAGSAIHRVT